MNANNNNKRNGNTWIIVLVCLVALVLSSVACAITSFNLLDRDRQPEWDMGREPEWDHDRDHKEPEPFNPDMGHHEPEPFDPDMNHHEPEPWELQPVEPVEPDFIIPVEPGVEKIPGWEPEMGPVNPSLDFPTEECLPESECFQPMGD
ncbi:MAG: hypothetical protein JEZ06_14410 [Anaerolineaceae bacterium]|nr:hypothetical protein [Anaerolineaceae bacterium]